MPARNPWELGVTLVTFPFSSMVKPKGPGWKSFGSRLNSEAELERRKEEKSRPMEGSSSSPEALMRLALRRGKSDLESSEIMEVEACTPTSEGLRMLERRLSPERPGLTSKAVHWIEASSKSRLRS
mmetsp:Transcript_44386/g.95671  ORF Transcript_44386/g.95671 Transcript_44386/m.95671 type:complete len:126 (+) Transcript_44386:1401-1778(+)